MWLILSLCTAFFSSLKDVFSKKATTVCDNCMVAWSWGFFAVPFLILAFIFFGVPKIKPLFWFLLLTSGFLYALSSILYIKALRHGDLSHTIPMLTFTPFFLLFTSPIIVGEFPSQRGLFGILLIVLGSYVLNITKQKDGYLAPFHALFHEEGSRYMLCVAFIWSITSNLDKIGVQNSSPITWALGINSFLAIALLPLVIRSRHRGHAFPIKVLFLPGLCNALIFIFQMFALQLTLVAYVNALKRTSAIISVFWGYLLFHEKIKPRLLGACVMVFGAVLIAMG